MRQTNTAAWCVVVGVIGQFIIGMQQARNLYRFSSTLPLVIVRHGETQHNKFKQWSGWHDAKLSPRGEEEAQECGRILKTHGFQFDIAYSSRLSRSIRTLNFILDELDCAYLPVRKRWQLNEKFYGALQGLDKMKIVEAYGEQMVGEWRRSYLIAPPKVFPDDPRHPINDRRYRDVDVTLLPNTESLGDVLQRVRSLYEQEIRDQLKEGKRLLIVCHGSPIRAWTNILMNSLEGQSRKFNVPNAIPLLLQLNRDTLRVESWQLLGDAEKIKQKMGKLQRQLKKE